MRTARDAGAATPLIPIEGKRRGTATSRFGVSRREGHDASDFYRRFTPPAISSDDDVAHPDRRPVVDEIVHGDIRSLPETVAEGSVALMVTSPPYFSGKEYEVAMGEGHVPADYAAYLEMLHGVFAASVRALEPGGRMAVNVANLGRKPYRSLSADVIDLLQDLGLLLRGEVVWKKAKAAGGSCAWGTYQRPGDPVLRDLTERVVIASKGRFDRAVDPRTRARRGLPSEGSIGRDEFLEATTDLWEIPPESATRVGHPAPFPVELPRRLIELYTYRGDLVLDPFMGSGTTAVAALRSERNYLGYDTDETYVRAAAARVAREAERLAAEQDADRWRIVVPPSPAPVPDEGAPGTETLVARAAREGRRARELAAWQLEAAGGTVTGEHVRLGAGVEADFAVADAQGREWLVDVVGTFGATSAGLRRTEVVHRIAGKAALLAATRPGSRYVLLASDPPPARSTLGGALKVLCTPTGEAPALVAGVVDLRSEGAGDELAALFSRA